MTLLTLACPGTTRHTKLRWNVNARPQANYFHCKTNLIDKRLNVTGFGSAPYYFKNERDEYVGTGPEIIRILQERFGFKAQFEMDSSWFGVEIDDRGQPRYTGFIGKVHNRQAHVGIPTIFLMESLHKLVDFVFTCSFYDYYKTAKPKRLPPYLNLMKPFSKITWLLILVTLLFTILVYMGITYILHMNTNDSIMNGIVIVMSQFCQGEYGVTNSAGGRLKKSWSTN